MSDSFFVVCDGLKGLPEVVAKVWPQVIVQTCIIHLIRNTFRLTSRRYWDEIKRDLQPIYTAVNATAARAAFDDLAEKWGPRYPAVVRLWDNAWTEFIAFLDYDIEFRTVICSTNAIESLNARYRRAMKDRGHVLNEQAALKVPLPGHPIAGPHRAGASTMDDAVEVSSQRVRDHRQRPLPGGRNLLMETAENTVSEIDPHFGPAQVKSPDDGPRRVPAGRKRAHPE